MELQTENPRLILLMNTSLSKMKQSKKRKS